MISIYNQWAMLKRLFTIEPRKNKVEFETMHTYIHKFTFEIIIKKSVVHE